MQEMEIVGGWLERCACSTQEDEVKASRKCATLTRSNRSHFLEACRIAPATCEECLHCERNCAQFLRTQRGALFGARNDNQIMKSAW